MGLTTLGSLLKRQRYIDQVDWRVYPNQSVLLIGPSGIGKDTAINRAQRCVEEFEDLSGVPVLGGATLENLQTRLHRLPVPACAYLPAPELTKFFGKADYQANMLTGVTDLLSTGEKIDITTKGNLIRQDGSVGAPKYIYQPTLTLHGGSTIEWLHRHMPDGTLEGGFLGRFLILVEEIGGRHVPLVKTTAREVKRLQGQLALWNQGVRKLIDECKREAREVIILNEAEDIYTNWYYNRFRIFSKAVLPYANRSRDTILRLAMLMAVSRNHTRFVQREDMDFAIQLMGSVAERIDRVVLPPTEEAQAATQIVTMLPASEMEIYSTLGVRYKTFVLRNAVELLERGGRMRYNSQTRRYEKRTE